MLSGGYHSQMLNKIWILSIVAIVYGLFSQYRMMVVIGALFFLAFTAYRFIIYRAEIEYEV